MNNLAINGGSPLLKKKLLPKSKMFVEYPVADIFSEFLGADYALMTSSGTASLICALIGAGVKPGDEVITVSHSWYCTATSILQVGAVPVFVDIEAETFNMAPQLIQEKIYSRTKAILSVSLFGHPSDAVAISKIAKENGLVHIDDACQSFGARINGVRLGSLADITAFSFSGKPIVSTGGGVLSTNNRSFYERSMLGGEHPSFISTQSKNPEVWQLASTGGYGNHYRIDGRCAQRAVEALEKLDAQCEWRRKNVSHLIGRLSKIKGIHCPVEKEAYTHVFHMFTCLFDENVYGISRDEFVDAVVAEGVPMTSYISSVNFLKKPDGTSFNAGPLHRRYLFQKLAQDRECGPFKISKEHKLDYSQGSLPITEKMCDLEFNIHQRSISAPFETDDMDLIADAIEKVLHHSDEIIANRKINKKRQANFMMAYQSDS